MDSDYLLGQGDELKVWVPQLDEISGKSFTVDRGGCITLPLVGRLHIEGLTVEKAQELVRSSLERYVRDPEVGISLEQAKNESVAVTGAVVHPGAYQLSQGKTLVDMLMVAGGVQQQNAGPWAIIMRPLTSGPIPLKQAHDDESGRYSIAQVNVRAVTGLQESAENITLMAGDTISIPEARSVYVIGDVTRPGAFPVNDEQQTTALQVLAMAGGPLKTAAPQSAKVLRSSQTGQKTQLISVDLRQLMKGGGTDVQLRPNDILFVPSNAQKAAAGRALDIAIQTGLAALTYGVLYR